MNLTDQQRVAVEAAERDVYVVAAAGSGKTRVLVARAEHLLAQGVHPNHILMLTFTRKAAGELGERVFSANESLADRVPMNPRVGTFHAAALSALRDAGRKVRIIGDSDLDDIIKIVARDLNYLDGKKWKNGVTLAEVLDVLDGDPVGERPTPAESVAAAVLDAMRTHSLYTYRMLLVGWLNMLLTSNDASHWQAGIRHVLLDEAQDCDELQCETIEALQARGAAVFAVGDPRQRIYGWRGACGWNGEIPTTYQLTECHRCPPAVLEPANRLMGDYPALTCPDQRIGGFNVETGRTTFVISALRDFVASQYDFSDIAILCRTNRQAKRYQARLAELAPEIPTYRVGRTWDDTQAPEFRATVAILRLMADMRNTLLFRLAAEAVNMPRADELAARPSGEHLDALGLSVKNEASTLELVSMASARVTDANADIIRWWEHNCPMVGWASLQTCLDWLEAYTPDEEEIPEGRVVISTIHQVKGLEFPVVLVPDLNEGNLPTSQSIRAGDVEEERRCLYVAMTRAQEVLILHHRRPEDQAVGREIQAPSRFLEAINGNH